MRRSWLGWLAVAAFGTLGAACARAPAADTTFAGTWKVVVLTGDRELTAAVVRIDGRPDRPRGKLVAGLPSSPVAKATLESLSAKGPTLRFTLNGDGTRFLVRADAPRGEEKPKRLLGSLTVGANVEPVLLEPTDDTEIAAEKAVRPMDGAKDLQAARAVADAAERGTKLKELQTKYAGKPLGLAAAQALFQSEVAAKSGADALRGAADRYLKEASAYGPEVESNAAYLIARVAERADKEGPLALEYARKAAKLTGAGDPPARQAAVLKVLAAALRNGGKADEAKEVDARLDKLEDAVDKEFLKTAIPFKPGPFAGRKGESSRVVLVELFTGAQCPPCVAADIAFDAALQTYKPTEAVFLEYHLHIPGPDPLTNADTEAREQYYKKEVEGTPTMILDGAVTDPMGGYRQHGKDRYEALRKRVEKGLETKAGAKLKLTVKRDGDKLNLQAQVDGLAKPGEKVRLRFVLVEDVVRYGGRNGQRLHHHVVRSFPGGVQGVALTEKSATKGATVSLAELRKGLDTYLTAAGKERPFLDAERPLRLEHLKVVAFVQDDDGKAVLQAAQVDVPAAK